MINRISRTAAIVAWLCIAPNVACAAWVDTGIKGENAGSDTGGAGLTVVLTGTTAGQLAVIAWGVNRATTTPTCPISDSGGNTWSSPTIIYATPQGSCMAYSVLTTGGDLTVTVKGNGSNTYSIYVAGHVFGNPHATPASGTPVTATGSGTTSDTGAFTASDADALYVAFTAPTSVAAITENVAPGDTNWSLSNEDQATGAGKIGSLVYYIASGAAPSRRAAWTNASTTWAAIIAGFRPALDGGSDLMLLGAD